MIGDPLAVGNEPYEYIRKGVLRLLTKGRNEKEKFEKSFVNLKADETFKSLTSWSKCVGVSKSLNCHLKKGLFRNDVIR